VHGFGERRDLALGGLEVSQPKLRDRRESRSIRPGEAPIREAVVDPSRPRSNRLTLRQGRPLFSNGLSAIKSLAEVGAGSEFVKTWILAGAAVAALIGATAHAQPAHSLAEDAQAFGARESIESIDLSPDGKKVVYIEPAAGGSAIAYIADVESGTTRGFLKARAGKEQLEGCSFVTNARLICSYGGTVEQAGLLVGFSRLIAINSDGSDIKSLGQRESAYDERLRQFDGDIVDWLPNEDGAVLMAREYIPEAGKSAGSRISRSADGVGLDRVDTRTLASKPVERPRRGVSGYMTDGRGNVRLLTISEANSDGVLTGRVRIDYRPSSSREWKTLSGFASEKIVPLAVDATSNSLYALKKLNGRDALYRIRLSDPIHTELVASHPRVDIDNVIRSSNGERIIGYSFVEDKREVFYFDPELFDRTAKQLNELFLARPQLEKRSLASVKPVTVRVADGTDVPAYLTLPPGTPPTNLPAVVLPHGGPSSRDEWGFDWLAQFLAARGYAVIQPQLPRLGGFGDAWLMDNGFKSWRTSVGDITGSARWLAAKGIADPNRLAIVGWSYGGYAALQAAATEPDLFKGGRGDRPRHRSPAAQG
jgi:dipeptidyl aminopeptidase/acylaminoacyl peptidase